jgi:hypothetical protein
VRRDEHRQRLQSWLDHTFDGQGTGHSILRGRAVGDGPALPQEQDEKWRVEESRRDLRMFVAGVASAAHIIFGKPASITQIEACVSGIKNHFGGAFCAAEDLVDSGVLLVPPHDDDKPMVYHVDNPVEIKQEFSRNHRKECEELGQKIYKQEFGNSPKVTVSILPKILKDARAAIEQHERFSRRLHERTSR